jgi:predicted nucleotidyltransferase
MVGENAEKFSELLEYTRRSVDTGMRELDHSLLDKAVRQIVTALQPEKIYLYGSHAYGQPHQDSDVDLLVVVFDSPLPPHRRAVEAYRALRGLFLPAEIKVVTSAEFERRAQWLSSIERVVREKGKVLYEAPPG